eukprot:g11017.t1
MGRQKWAFHPSNKDDTALLQKLENHCFSGFTRITARQASVASYADTLNLHLAQEREGVNKTPCRDGGRAAGNGEEKLVGPTDWSASQLERDASFLFGAAAPTLFSEKGDRNGASTSATGTEEERDITEKRVLGMLDMREDVREKNHKPRAGEPPATTTVSENLVNNLGGSASHDAASSACAPNRAQNAGELRSIHDLEGRWHSDSGLEIVVRNAVCTWLNLPPSEGSDGPPSVAFTSRQTLAIDGDEYAIEGCDYFEQIVCGLRWSDGDYWHREEQELHELVAKNLRIAQYLRDDDDTKLLSATSFNPAARIPPLPSSRRGFLQMQEGTAGLATEARLDAKKLRNYLIDEAVTSMNVAQRKAAKRRENELRMDRDRMNAVLHGSRLPMRAHSTKKTDVLSLYQSKKKVWDTFPTLKHDNPHDIKQERTGTKKQGQGGGSGGISRAKPFFSEGFFLSRDTFATAARKRGKRHAEEPPSSAKNKHVGRETVFTKL